MKSAVISRISGLPWIFDIALRKSTGFWSKVLIKVGLGVDFSSLGRLGSILDEWQWLPPTFLCVTIPLACEISGWGEADFRAVSCLVWSILFVLWPTHATFFTDCLILVITNLVPGSEMYFSQYEQLHLSFENHGSLVL